MNTNPSSSPPAKIVQSVVSADVATAAKKNITGATNMATAPSPSKVVASSTAVNTAPDSVPIQAAVKTIGSGISTPTASTTITTATPKPATSTKTPSPATTATSNQGTAAKKRPLPSKKTSPFSTNLKSGPAYWDSIKSRLLATSSSSRAEALRLLTELRDKNLSTSLAPTATRHLSGGNAASGNAGSNSGGGALSSEHSLLLSALIPALSKLLVSPGGKASVMLNAGKEKGGAKGGGSKKRKNKGDNNAGKDGNKNAPANATTTATTNATAAPPNTADGSSNAALHPKQSKPSKASSDKAVSVPKCHVPPSSSISNKNTSLNHQIRHTSLLILEQLVNLIIGKLPHNELFRAHAPSILSIAIHVLIEDYEENAILANVLLMKVLKGYKSLGSASNDASDNNSGGNAGIMATLASSGKEGARMLRECQVVLDFVAECYKGSCKKGNLAKCFEFDVSRFDAIESPVTLSITSGSATSAKASTSPAPPGAAAKGASGTPSESTGSAISLGRKEGVASTPSPSLSNAHNTSNIISTPQQSPSPLSLTGHLKSSRSFRLLIEMPVTVMFLFQLCPKLVKNNVPTLIPAMIEMLKVIPPNPSTDLSKVGHNAKGTPVPKGGTTPGRATGGNVTTPSLSTPKVLPARVPHPLAAAITPARAPQEPSASSSVSSSVMTPLSSLPPATPAPTPAPRNEHQVQKRHYQTQVSFLISSQVKTLSFLAYFLRGFAENMKPFEDGLAVCVLQLLKNCPREAFQARKELLVSTRHILATDFRRGFYRHVDAMLDERLLIGSTRSLSSKGGLGIGGDSTASFGGDGGAGSSSSLLPLGYSILAEFLHHVRSRLTPAQLSRVIRIFSRVLHCSNDTQMKMPMSLQITSAKLLAHLVDLIFRNKDPNPQVGRDLLVRILSTLVHKLEFVKEKVVPDLMKAVEREMKEAKEKKEKSGSKDWEENPFEDYESPRDDITKELMFEGTYYAPATPPSIILRDVQLLLRPMIHGMKTIFWCISSYSHQREKERQRALSAGEEQFQIPAYALNNRETRNEEVNSGTLKMTAGERELVVCFIRVGLPCLRVFQVNVAELEKQKQQLQQDALGEGNNSKKVNPRHREILEMFAVSFTSLESYNFRKVIAPNLQFMMEEMDKDQDGIAIMFSHLLLTTGKAVSYEFCEVLLTYLMEEIGTLGEYEKETSSPLSEPLHQSPQPNELLRSIEMANSSAKEQLSPSSVLIPSKRARNLSKIFGLAFSSLLKYPRNEVAFLPNLQTLVKECVQRSTEGPKIWPGPYLNTLRSLFRTLSGGKFEHSYKELGPLVPTLLNGLYRIYTLTGDRSFRFVILELCLTIPSRLSALLPHLPLLVKIIIPALRSNQGDLINLGLRTMEFWVENLHPSDYLYPILAQDSTQLCELMMALTSHLQPAPYPYGLLCMRLLGKMGGMNRLFMSEMVNLQNDPNEHGDQRINVHGLAMYCEWQGSRHEGKCKSGVESSSSNNPFLLPFPLSRAVDVLRCVAAAPCIVRGSDATRRVSPSSDSCQSKYFSSLLQSSYDARNLDLNSFSIDQMEETKQIQSKSAFSILRAALASIVDIEEEDGHRRISICTKHNGADRSESKTIGKTTSEEKKGQEVDTRLTPQQCRNYNDDFKLICDGLFAATVHDDLREEAMLLLKGLGAHLFFLTVSHRSNITKIDGDGCPIDPFHEVNNEKFDSQNHIADGKLQPLKPFGCFRLSGPLDSNCGIAIDPFVFNESLANAFTDADVKNSHTAAMAVMHYVTDLFHRVKGVNASPEGGTNEEIMDGDYTSKVATETPDTVWGDVLFENLLRKLQTSCFSQPWNFRSGAMAGLFELIHKMGLAWSKQYEVEILHTAMFLVKDTPDGIAHASKDSIRFFLQVSWLFFGGPKSWKEEPGSVSSPLIYDVLCPTMSNKSVLPVQDKTSLISVKKSSLTLILSEIASTKPLVRFAVRHALRLMTRDSASIDALLSNHVNSLKRLLFPKLLRTLPLPNQCAAVEACAFILDRAPKLIPIADQNLLAFLSELLKMISIADGEFSDSNFGSVVLIDKNGFAVNNGGEPTTQNRSTVRPSSLFLRKSIVLEDESFGGRIQVPAELPLGVQLRVSTLLLFRGLIRGFSDEFYDADQQSKIGNIRPHVVALLFRSLIAEPAEIVSSSASALHNALVLCVPSKDSMGGSSSKGHRLPKELIQSCIRPILLHLREYTKLTIPLLRGLSRLLGLLSSWFNKTLGEKLLEHLHRFTEPEKIIELQIWKPGDEPLIAAAVMDLFSVLPQASHFVEMLVKHTIKLESVLPRYKPCQNMSPFRGPLARYLNRHGASAVGFFLEEHRLCNPVYSSLFQDLLKRDDTALLRKYICGNSVMLLNVCFERPLAIIRSEKTTPEGGKSSSLAVYGINQWGSPSAQRKLEVARQNVEMKKKFLALKTQDEARSQKALQSKADDPKSSEYQSVAQAARESVECAKRELEEARNSYINLSQASSQRNAPDSEKDTSIQRSMTVSALELQHQGFKIVEILASFNPQYLENHNDVVRALRWLWRSRGRHYRLLHEEEISPRYHCESLALGKFLVRYAQENTKDTDVLFDLIRIFLQPLSSVDFSFIKHFLLNMVSSVFSVEQKSQILQRFSSLLSSEGSEETKILSAQMLAIPMLKRSSAGSIFKDHSVKLFIESLLKDGGSYGPKLTCELLQIVDVLIERMQSEDMTNYRKDLLKYIWNALKCNEPTTKYYGYLAVSRFIAVFETPSKVIQQVYHSLLRDTSERNTVRAAMDLLLPVLKKRLGDEELEDALKYTTKVIRESFGNSIPQMVHLWETITRHPLVYVCQKAAIMPHILQSLSFFGQQPKVPSEISKLSVALAKLIIEWGGTSLDQNDIDTVLSILFRIAFVNADGNPDRLQQQIRAQILSLLKDILASRKNCKIDSSHFQSLGARGSCRDIMLESKSSNTTLKESSDSKSDENEGAIRRLVLCTEIVLNLLCYDPKNDFLEVNICVILNQCFGNAIPHENKKFAQILEDILFHLLVDGYASNETVSYIVAIIENTLRNGKCHDRKDCRAYLAVSVIERVSETNQHFVEPLLGSLAVFAEGLANRHIQGATSQASIASSVQHMAEDGHHHQLAATPTLGIFEAACGLGFKPPCQVGNGGFKNEIVIENEILGASLKSLISSLRLLGSSCSLLTFSSTRKTIIKMLGAIIDSSNSLPVLIQAVSIIGNWVTSDIQRMPLTKSEREGFLWQLASFDFQRLPEVSSQALGDMMCCIVLSAYGYNPSIIQEFPFGLSKCINSNDFSHHLEHREHIVKDETFHLLLVSSLLSSNPYVRSLCMGISSTQMDDCILVHEILSNIANERGCRKGDSIDIVGIPNITPSHVLHQVLQFNFEALGKRLWTTAIVDVLLASGNHIGGVRLGHEGIDHQIFVTHTDGKGINSCPGYLRLNYKNAGLGLDEYDAGCYSSFTKVLKSERSGDLCGRGRCIAAIRNLVHGDVNTCQSMLEICFQAAWQCLPSNRERASLIEPLERLIAKPFHSQFFKARQCSQINAVQSILRLLVHLRPMPLVDPFLLQAQGVNYNGNIEALSLLESQYAALKTNGYDADSPSRDLIKAIRQCYESLGDRDVSIYISSVISSFPGTKFALSLDMYDLVNDSTDAYLSLIDRADGSHADFLPSECEMVLWEERWIEAHKELSQWALIDEFASSIGNTNLMLECAWKTNNWEKAKCCLSLPSVVASLEEGDPLTKMTEIYLAIHEGNLEEVENLHAQTAQLCLHQWKLLPSVGLRSKSHIGLLQQFQRLVELRETSQIMVETSSHSARRTIPDLKLLLGSWRQRLPNSFERVSDWNDIFLWRFQIFDAITTNFSWADPNTVTTLHDRPFACISLGRTARKQGLTEVAAFSLNSLTDCTIDVEYAFLKLREQIVSLQTSSVESLKGGLNLVNSTNLSFFDSLQKAEMFRLKAYFFNALNEKPKSNQAYCHAVQICPTYARAWMDWGRLCASLSDDTRKQAKGQKANSKDLTKKTGLYLVQAMGCFLEAVRCDPNEQTRDHIPYCLSMLTNDGPSYGNLCRTFETRSSVLPSWVWLPWIPQLLSSLCRVEARAMKAILVGILKDHPQALYYSLRSFYLERRDIERSKSQKSSSPNDDDAPSSSRLAEELMSNLRKTHPILWLKLEHILEDLIVRFRPSYEAELLHSVVALHQKASMISDHEAKRDGSAGRSGQMEACTKTLAMLGMKFFNFNRERSESQNQNGARKSARFQAKYASLFTRDFLEKNSTGSNRDNLVDKLQKWKVMLELGISRVPDRSNLQEVSPSLSWFSSQAPDLWAGACESKSLSLSNSQHDALTSLDNALFKAKRSSALAAAKINAQAVSVAANSEGLGGHTGGGAAVIEIPGQYAPTSSSVLDSRPFPELHVKLVKFHQTLELTSTSTKQHVHRITMIGNDGKAYRFLLQLAIPYWIRTDERSAQVQYVMEKALRKDIRARRRFLTSKPSVVIPIAQRMRMSANETSHQSLDSIFRHVQGPKVNKLASHFQEKVTSHLRDLGDIQEAKKDQAMKDAKLKIYQDICNKLVLPNIISKFMMETIPSAERLFQFRHVFTSQLAANSLLQYAFAVVERTPNRFVFCNSTGKILSQDFRSQYNHGLLEKHNVPFRMTRNITEFIGPFLLEGVFVPSFTIVSSAMHSKRSVLEPILHLLLRDDVMSWYISKSCAKNDQKIQEVERQLSDRVWSNIRFVQDRFEECSPRDVTDAAVEAVKSKPDPIDIKVRSLVDAATSAEKLSMMPSAYQAWL